MKKIFFCLIAVVLPALISTPVSSQGNSWHIESIQPLSTLLEGVVAPERAFPAPDGTQIAYERKPEGGPSSICARNLMTGEERCIELPPDQNLRLVPHMFFTSHRWSPDSGRIALVGLPYVYMDDSDLTVANLATLTLTNLAEDNFAGALFPSMPDGASTESQPAWSPDSAQIAVERAVVSGGGRLWEAMISIFNTSGGNVRDVTPLPGHEFWTVDAGSVASLDWSPDGMTLAIALHHREFEPGYDGIWLLDVESAELTWLVSPEQALAAARLIYPDAAEVLSTHPVSWSPDGSRLLYWSAPQAMSPDRQWVFWVDVASGTITPLLLPAGSKGTRTIWPSHAIWSPDGSQLLIVARQSTAPDPTATILYTSEDSAAWFSFHLIDVATGEDTLLGYAPSVPSVPQTGVWSPDGHVIVGGYSFRLVQ